MKYRIIITVLWHNKTCTNFDLKPNARCRNKHKSYKMFILDIYPY